MSELEESIRRHNATMDRARRRLAERIDFSDAPAGARIQDMGAYFKAKWAPFRPLLRRIRSRSFRAQGFVKCGDAPGWKYNA